MQILRDSTEPLSVAEVAAKVGVHLNTARFHLDALVEAGRAERTTQPRPTPGRRPIVYSANLADHAHESAQGYRLLARMLTDAIARQDPNAGPWLYQVGLEWGGYLTTHPAPSERIDEAEVAERLVDKLDALWFAPEVVDAPTPELVLHNCPFIEQAIANPQVVCELHAGMINGSLAQMGSGQRLVHLYPLCKRTLCRGVLGPAADAEASWVPLTCSPSGGGNRHDGGDPNDGGRPSVGGTPTVGGNPGDGEARPGDGDPPAADGTIPR
jgi:predicted ArsR family transcriptional regulator